MTLGVNVQHSILFHLVFLLFLLLPDISENSALVSLDCTELDSRPADTGLVLQDQELTYSTVGI